MDTNPNAVDFLRIQRPRILVVVDNEQVRISLERVLKSYQFQIATATNIGEALRLIDAEFFDVLLSDWRVTEVEGGFAAVSALQHKNLDAFALVYTGFPALKDALDAIQAACSAPTEPLSRKAENQDTRQPTYIEQVAAIVGQDVFETMMDWLDRVNCDDELTRVPLSTAERIGQLPSLLWELAQRLRSPRRPCTQAGSEAATKQGKLRQSQGYSMGMVAEESRVLQVSVFETLYKRMSAEDFRLVLSNAETITDECDCLLRQILSSFTRQAAKKAA
jgi:CheY-like chemotaxis protein